MDSRIREALEISRDYIIDAINIRISTYGEAFRPHQLDEMRKDLALVESEIAILTAEPDPCEKQSLLFVDATPNDGYVARILSAYIDDTYYSDNTIGLPPENPLVKQMNEWREQRNILLRDAISKLRSTQVADKRAEELRAHVDKANNLIIKLVASLDAMLRESPSDVIGYPSSPAYVIADAIQTEGERYVEALSATEPKPSTPKEPCPECGSLHPNPHVQGCSIGEAYQS